MLVAPDVDALCAARMLADLLKQDDVLYRIIPVSGYAELERMRDELETSVDVRSYFVFTGIRKLTFVPVAHLDTHQYGSDPRPPVS